MFQRQLTELEAAGLQAAAAQSIALGKSAELAQEEMVRAASVGAQILTLDDPAYPPLLKQIYDPPVALYVRGDPAILSDSRHWSRRHPAPDAVRPGHGRTTCLRPFGPRDHHY